MENNKKITFIEFMLFGSGPKSFDRNGTAERENYYYSLFNKNNLYPKLIEYSINRQKYKGFLKIIIVVFKLLYSAFNPISILLLDKNFQFIRCKQIYGSWSGIILKMISQKKLIIRVGYSWSQSILFENGRDSFKYKIAKVIENFILKNADGLIVSSEYLYKKFFKLNNRITVIPNGINNKIFKIKKSKFQYDYIFVGRLIYIKGIDRILDFVSLEKNKSFIFIGSNPLQIDFKKFKNVTQINNVKNKELPYYMNISKIILNLSRSEGSPKALIEGIGCGCFPLISNIEAHRDLLEDLKYGSLINFPKKEIKKIGEFNNKNYINFINKYSLNNCVEEEIRFMKKFI